MRLYSAAEFDGKISSGKITEYNGDSLRLSSKDQIDADIASMTRDVNETKEALRAKEVQMRNDLSEQNNPKLSSTEIQQKTISDQHLISA